VVRKRIRREKRARKHPARTLCDPIKELVTIFKTLAFASLYAQVYMAHMFYNASRLSCFSSHSHRSLRSHPVSLVVLRRRNQTQVQSGNIPINSASPPPPPVTPRKPLIVIPSHLKSAPSSPGGVKLIPTKLKTEEIPVQQQQPQTAPIPQIPRDIRLPEIKWASQGVSENRYSLYYLYFRCDALIHPSLSQTCGSE
jgi:hypothetical protein